MTDASVPDPIRIDVVCMCCSATASIWIYPEEITSMRFCWSPLDNAYLHTCGKCLYQRVPADDPLPHQCNADPERAQHAKRTSGGYHTQEWRMTQ